MTGGKDEGKKNMSAARYALARDWYRARCI